MKKSLLIVIIVLSLVFVGCASQKRPTNSFFLQMADTQFGFFTDNRDFGGETVNFEKAIAEANRLRPAFVIVCGDLVNKPGDDEQINEYKRIASLLNPGIPLYNVSGNHDVGNTPTAESLAEYKKKFGSDYYTFESGRIFGIVVNSSLMKDPTSAPKQAAAQEEWLRTTLSKVRGQKDRLAVVFMHHSLFLKDPLEKDDYFNFSGPTRAHYLKLFTDSGIRYIFAGHYHRNAFGRAGDLEMVTTGPVGRPLGKDPSGFRIVVIDGESLRHTYYSLDSIPELVR
jgi:serine/threonine-protein phosphatase CPPED1